MKDARGHGSNGSGAAVMALVKQHQSSEASLFGGGSSPILRGSSEYPARGSSSDQAASAALLMGVKSGVVPVHDSMAGRASNPTTAPSPQNKRPGEGVMKGERTSGQLANHQLVSQTRFGLRNT